MKIFTKLICLSIVAVSLLTGCDIENRCSCIEIENNVEYFINVKSSFKNKGKIIRSSQELLDIFYKDEINQDVYPDAKEIIKMYDDDFFNENALVAISQQLSDSYDCKVTAFKTKDKKVQVTIDIKTHQCPGFPYAGFVNNWLILIEVSQEEIKDCTDVEVTIAEPSC